MNEFNPFETLGIDPNESMPSRIPLDTQTQVNPIETAWQFNPFEELNINVNWFQQPTANGKDTEVSSMLWIDQFTPMTDDEKQSYVDALSDEDWNTWNQLKSEWYSFEARKALLENRESLYDINKAWTQKYFTEYVPIEDKYDVAQNMVNWYQNRAQGFWDRMEENVSEFLNYKKDWTERWWYPWKKIANLVNHVVSKWAQIIDDALNIWMQAMEARSVIDVARGKTDKIVDFNENAENYKSVFASSVWLATWIGEATLMTVAPYVYGAFWILGQGNGPVAKLINWLAIPFELGAEWIVDLALTNDRFQEYLNKPENAWAEEELKEGVSLALMAIVWKYLKSKNEAWWKTRMGRFYTETKTKVWNAIKKGAEYAKGTREMMETDPRFSETSELTKTQNVIKATWRGLKEWRNKDLRLEETPTETVAKWEAIESKEITPYEQERQRQIQQRKTDIINQTKDLKISDESKNNLANNPDLQTEFKNTIKPYLEANWKSNPEWVISEPINDLVYDIKSWIDELRVQQANLNRSINNKRLTPVEKALIKEIEKIINKKEPKQIFNWLKKLTPEQLWLLERTVPNLSQRIQTIWQMLDLTMEITKNDLVWRFLRFQAERPRKGITWFAKKLLYDYIKDLYDQRWIQSSTESIDRFIDSLSDQQKSDIVKTIENSNGELSDSVKKSLSDIVNEMEVEWEPTEIRRLNESEKTEDIKRNRDQLEDEWYTPETRLYTVDKNGKLVSHEVSKELEIKPFWSDKQLKDIFKTAWVNLTIPSELMFKIRYAKDADWVYMGDKDLIAVPWKSVAVWVLAHEFGHRVMAQLTENEKLKIIEDIKKKNYWMTDKAAEERFAEYFRNYFLYWNIYGVTALETFTTAVWQKAWQRIVNIMEKTKMDLFADLWANSEIDMYQKTKSIDKMIDSIYKLKEKGTEIITRETEQGSRALAEEETARNVWTLEKFSKSDLPNDLDLSEIKKATNELKNIHINDDWYIVGDYHWHETPVYDYIEDSNLPKDLKEYLKKQETSYLEEQNKWILDRLEELEKDSLFQGNDGEIKYSSEWNLKLGPWYYFGWRKQAWEFGKNLTKLEKQEWWKFYEPKDTQTYQVEASKYGWKEKYNEYLKEQGYDWIKAMNKAFWDYEYNFFTNPIK